MYTSESSQRPHSLSPQQQQGVEFEYSQLYNNTAQSINSIDSDDSDDNTSTNSNTDTETETETHILHDSDHSSNHDLSHSVEPAPQDKQQQQQQKSTTTTKTMTATPNSNSNSTADQYDNFMTFLTSNAEMGISNDFEKENQNMEQEQDANSASNTNSSDNVNSTSDVNSDVNVNGNINVNNQDQTMNTSHDDNSENINNSNNGNHSLNPVIPEVTFRTKTNTSTNRSTNDNDNTNDDDNTIVSECTAFSEQTNSHIVAANNIASYLNETDRSKEKLRILKEQRLLRDLSGINSNDSDNGENDNGNNDEDNDVNKNGQHEETDCDNGNQNDIEVETKNDNNKDIDSVITDDDDIYGDYSAKVEDKNGNTNETSSDEGEKENANENENNTTTATTTTPSMPENTVHDIITNSVTSTTKNTTTENKLESFVSLPTLVVDTQHINGNTVTNNDNKSQNDELPPNTPSRDNKSTSNSNSNSPQNTNELSPSFNQIIEKFNKSPCLSESKEDLIVDIGNDNNGNDDVSILQSETQESTPSVLLSSSKKSGIKDHTNADPFANLLNKTQGMVDSIKSNPSKDPSMTEHPNIALERNNSDVTTTTANNRYTVDGDDYGSIQGERNGNSVEEMTGSVKTNVSMDASTKLEHPQEQHQANFSVALQQEQADINIPIIVPTIQREQVDNQRLTPPIYASRNANITQHSQQIFLGNSSHSLVQLPAVPRQPARRSMKLRLQEEQKTVIPAGLDSAKKRGLLSGSFFSSSTRRSKSHSLGDDSDLIVENLYLDSSTMIDRGTVSVSWYEGTTTVELQDFVTQSVSRKLRLGSKKVLRNFRVLDESVQPNEEIVLSSYIPNGSEFLCRFRVKDNSAHWKPNYNRAPDSPSAAPSPPAELERLQEQIKMIVESQTTLRPKPMMPDILEAKTGKVTPNNDEVVAHNEMLSNRLEKLSETLLRLHEDGPYAQQQHDAPMEKRQVIFTIANYFILFLSLVAISAEIHERMPKWMDWLDANVTSVQNCAADQSALFECVSQGDFSGLIASIILWASTSVSTKQLFLFGFDTPQKLWTVVYEAGVSAFCWGCSYMLIRRGLNPDTRPNFLTKYWKDAVYGSLAGFNAAFMKGVLKNLISQDDVLDVLDQRQLRIVSFLSRVFNPVEQ